jgi:hypothetical protein
MVFCFITTPGISQTKKEVRQWKKCQTRAEKSAEGDAKIEIYKKFIAKYPGHFFLGKARNRIATIAYKKISQKDDIAKYREFIAKYPDSSEADKARGIVADNDDFKKAESENTVKAFQDYLRLHADGKSTQLAKVGILGIRLANKSTDDMVALLRDHGLPGEYTPSDNPGPYQSRGFYKGEGFFLTLVSYSDIANLDIAFLVKMTRNRTVISMEGLSFTPRSIPNGATVSIAYKATRKYTFTRWDPFFIFIVARNSLPSEKLNEVYNDLTK